MEILNSAYLYDNVLPWDLGYMPFEECVKRNQIERRDGDGNFYVRVHKKNGLRLRLEKNLGWKKKIIRKMHTI